MYRTQSDVFDARRCVTLGDVLTLCVVKCWLCHCRALATPVTPLDSVRRTLSVSSPLACAGVIRVTSLRPGSAGQVGQCLQHVGLTTACLVYNRLAWGLTLCAASVFFFFFFFFFFVRQTILFVCRRQTTSLFFVRQPTSLFRRKGFRRTWRGARIWNDQWEALSRGSGEVWFIWGHTAL